PPPSARCLPLPASGASARPRRPPWSVSATVVPPSRRKAMPSTMMSSPRTEGVSVLVPVRNGARWLPRVLQAVVAQDTDHPIEVVVLEDGSRDGSPDILASASAADPRVRVVQ